MCANIKYEINGLTSKQVEDQREKYGKNEIIAPKNENVLIKLLKVLTEPMFLLLILAAIIYFILGEPRDGLVMLTFVIGIISIEAIQEWKTDKILKALEDLSAPTITVIRDGIEKVISSVNLVPGDVMKISEGVKIPADGVILKASTLSVDESSLTGESVPVFKVINENYLNENNDYWRLDYCYAGTLVIQGTATVLVEKIGSETEYGKIGENIASAPNTKTLLQMQTKRLVKQSGLIAGVLFILVTIVTYFNIPDHIFKDRIIESILSGITIAMAMIPEEFPVIFTVFLSMGAWRLAKKQSLVRRLPSVETLGAVTVLCVDKTGTITKNIMEVTETWNKKGITNMTEIMGMGCKIETYDPMEKAIISYCEKQGFTRNILFNRNLIKEFPFNDKTKMMGNVWEKEGDILIVIKGSSESIIPLCNLKEIDKEIIENNIYNMSKQGLRVIGIAKMKVIKESQIPNNILDCELDFIGLVGLSDPPRESVKEDIEICTKAGVRLVMITGDNGVTARAIAKQINMPNWEEIITGLELDKMKDEELRDRVKTVNIFSRVLPEHKMRIVKAFKENGEVVAMTGDGVNDAPALKYSDIGIAMGKRGSEVSREAADLILLDDNFSTIVYTIRDGRRIYDNIRKAVGYVFTIHIPIALASLLAPLMGISPSSLFLLPLHVVLLELVIDPTCSIVLERQPAETDIMDRKPRKKDEKLITPVNLFKSVIQGIVIFAFSFSMYYYYLNQFPENPNIARTIGLSIIFYSNILLVIVNSSNKDLAIISFFRQLKDKVTWSIIIGSIAGLYIMIYSPLHTFLKLYPLSFEQMIFTIISACAAVLWYEVIKVIKKLQKGKYKV